MKRAQLRYSSSPSPLPMKGKSPVQLGALMREPDEAQAAAGHRDLAIQPELIGFDTEPHGPAGQLAGDRIAAAIEIRGGELALQQHDAYAVGLARGDHRRRFFIAAPRLRSDDQAQDRTTFEARAKAEAEAAEAEQGQTGSRAVMDFRHKYAG